MDSSLEGQYANEDATELVELASKCLQYEAKDRPDIKFLLSAVAPLQKQKEVCKCFLLPESYVVLLFDMRRVKPSLIMTPLVLRIMLTCVPRLHRMC